MSIIKELTELGKEMVRKGLVVGPGGNISGRDGNHAYLSPSGFDLDQIKPRDWSVIDLKREKQIRGPRPTCEVEMHMRILQARPEIRLICHAHPATTVGIISAGKEVLPLTPDFVALVDRVEYLPYIIPAGHELAVAAQKAFRKGVNVVCLRNHGAITVGRTARETLTRMIVLEDHAQSMVAAAIVGRPRALNAKQRKAILALDAETYRKKLQAGG
jgi:L-fuculose-phosphate aldolase